MLVTALGRATAVALLGLTALTLPAQANPAETYAVLSQDPALQRAIAGLQSQENDFFATGQARFETEVRRLQRGEDDAETPVLTIDASALVVPAAVESPQPLHQQPAP